MRASADANCEAIQRDQFVDGLTDSDIQESLWKEDINGFGPTIERAFVWTALTGLLSIPKFLGL